jgi:hypothetical protein
MGKDLEASGRHLIKDTTPELTWRDRGKPRKISIPITGLRAEIWTQELPNTKQEYWPLDHEDGFLKLDIT